MKMLTKASVALVGVLILSAIVANSVIPYALNRRSLPVHSAVSPLERILTADTIATTKDLDEVLQRDFVILHLDVDWSAQSLLSRPTVRGFIDSAKLDPRLKGVVFRRMDCSEQSGPLWESLQGWFDGQGADSRAMATGCGAIVWVKSGKVVHSIENAKEVGVEKLLEITQVFQVL